MAAASLGGDAGLVVVDLVEGVLDLAAELAGGLEFGQRGGDADGATLTRRFAGRTEFV